MSQRYFLTAESTYEDLRQALNTALAYPNALGKSVFQTALYAPRDNFRRVLLAVDTDLPGYATVSDSIAPLLASDAMEEIDEATYLAALATASSGGSQFDQSLNQADSPTFDDLTLGGTLTMYGGDITLGSGTGEFLIAGFGRAIGVETGFFSGSWSLTTGASFDFTEGTTSGISYDDLDDLPTLGTAAAADIGTGSTQVAAGDHTHTQLHDRSHAITSTSDHTATAWRVFYSDASGVQELALGNAGQALISNGASAAPSWGSAGSNSASDLTTGTLANARMTTRARAAMNLYLWSSFR